MTFLQGAALNVQHLRRALDAGEPAHAARALAHLGLVRTAKHPEQDHSALFARARELAASSGDPAARASVEVRHGSACLARDDADSARNSLDSLLLAHEILSLQCPGQPWLLAVTRMQLGAAFYVLGEHATLAARTEAWIVDAKQRDNLHAYAALVGYGFGFVRHLMRDDPKRARAELEEAMAPWPEEPFSTSHFGATTATQLILHYEGGDAALRWLERNQARLDRAAILKGPIFKSTLTNVRIIACLAALSPAELARGNARLESAQRHARTLRRLPDTPLNRSFITLWNSAFQALRGQREEALRMAREAKEVLCQRHKTYGTLSRYWEGWLEGGDSGRTKCTAVLDEMRQKGWSKPERAMAMMLPVFHLIERSG